MPYLLPRAGIVLVAWGLSCALIKSLWPNVDPAVFYVAGVSWALAGITCFGYIRKLRRDGDLLRDDPLRSRRSAT